MQKIVTVNNENKATKNMKDLALQQIKLSKEDVEMLVNRPILIRINYIWIR